MDAADALGRGIRNCRSSFRIVRALARVQPLQSLRFA
jgi:hypothetical protein